MERSFFDGSLIGLIFVNVFSYLLTALTFGLAYPWAVTMRLRWKYSHTVIEGRRLRFIGSGAGFIGTWLKIVFFSIITLGIYSFWAVIVIEKWKVKNTIYA
jgi:uncharacterized membrane protein YjgN (DUF898 family)